MHIKHIMLEWQLHKIKKCQVNTLNQNQDARYESWHHDFRMPLEYKSVHHITGIDEAGNKTKERFGHRQQPMHRIMHIASERWVRQNAAAAAAAATDDWLHGVG